MTTYNRTQVIECIEAWLEFGNDMAEESNHLHSAFADGTHWHECLRAHLNTLKELQRIHEHEDFECSGPSHP